MNYICNNTCSVSEEERLLGKGKGRRGVVYSRREPTACEPGQGCQRRWAVQGGTGGSPWHLCSSGTGSGTEQESCSLPAESPQCCVPCRRKGSRAVQAGSSVPQPGNFGKLALLPAGLGCSELQKALNSLYHAELWVFQLHFVQKTVFLSPHFRPPCFPPPLLRDVRGLLKTLVQVSLLHNAALHWGLPCVLLCA